MKKIFIMCFICLLVFGNTLAYSQSIDSLNMVNGKKIIDEGILLETKNEVVINKNNAQVVETKGIDVKASFKKVDSKSIALEINTSNEKILLSGSIVENNNDNLIKYEGYADNGKFFEVFLVESDNDYEMIVNLFDSEERNNPNTLRFNNMKSSKRILKELSEEETKGYIENKTSKNNVYDFSNIETTSILAGEYYEELRLVTMLDGFVIGIYGPDTMPAGASAAHAYQIWTRTGDAVAELPSGYTSYLTGVDELNVLFDPASYCTYKDPNPSDGETSISIPIYIPWLGLGWQDFSMETSSTDTGISGNNAYWNFDWTRLSMYTNDWQGTDEDSFNPYQSFVGAVTFFNNSDSGVGARTNTVSTDMTYAVYARNSSGSGLVIYPSFSSEIIYSVVVE